MTFTLDKEKNREQLEDFQQFLNEQKGKSGNLMVVLHRAQHDFGFIPAELQEMISDTLRIPRAEIYGVITFYSQFTLIPKGEMQVGVCMGTACYVKNAQKTLEAFEQELGIKAGETAPDGSASITATRCLGACGLAPVVAINDKIFGHLPPDGVAGAIESYRAEVEKND